MKRIICVLVFFSVPSFVLAQIPPQSLAPLFHQFEGASAVTYIRKVADIPGPALDVAKTVIKTKDFAMADAGQKWNATDVVEDINLPFRRLIWCTVVNDVYVMHYELGGVGHSFHFLVVSSAGKTGKRSLTWVAAGPQNALDLRDFAEQAQAGKLISDSRIGH